ncbi:tripartite ATP-independent transporter DctM subunit [Azospirillum brasilense]|uniref:TRAP transporter large permease protein n=1 Tax=Azospirillum brasilense TaxID=192 RepID=A0A560CDB9_AZOBR|nr:TRAP transporter large permease subunit [Azospirillum brasilense]MBK3734288.1 TRAP transporter large permease subunit [Azospirillum brasilense]TWA82854.1 tripartite ATP-independent transporter DctM subunit [Azospirillum brasilense]
MLAPSLFIVLALAGLLVSGLWVGMSLMAVGVFSLELFRDMRVDRFLASDLWSTGTALELVTLPLFILMGEVLFHSRLAENLFAGLSPFARLLPGRLIQVNVLASTLFATVSGSSAATTATVGRITIRELDKRGYSKMLSYGSLAGSGTMGFLIPPSIPMIVYGVLSEVSILDLFIAGVLPGLLLAALFFGYIAVRCALDPSLAPVDEARFTMAERVRAIGQLTPTVLLMAFVIGSMLGGFASITEAAAMGVLGAVILVAWERQLSWAMLGKCLLGTVKTCSMIGLILAGALFLTKAMARLAIPGQVAGMIEGLHLSPMMLVLLLLAFYLVLGCVIDGLSTIVMTLPVTLPLVVNAGLDPLWFGVFLIVTIEMAQITPPVGFNLFILNSMTGKSIAWLARAAAPFCALMVVHVALITLFPAIVTWLPAALR